LFVKGLEAALGLELGAICRGSSRTMGLHDTTEGAIRLGFLLGLPAERNAELDRRQTAEVVTRLISEEKRAHCRAGFAGDERPMAVNRELPVGKGEADSLSLGIAEVAQGPRRRGIGVNRGRHLVGVRRRVGVDVPTFADAEGEAEALPTVGELGGLKGSSSLD
jgi:hypothetical protein